MLAAIDKRVTVTSTLTDKAIIKIKSVLGTLEVPTYVSYQEVKSEFRPFVYLAKKIINSANWKNAKPAKGLEIEINSDIPVGVGLGSSSACCVAATASIYGLLRTINTGDLRGIWENVMDMEEIVDISIEAEKTIFPDTSGADCTVCTYGGMIVYDKINGIEKIDNTKYKIKDFETVTDLNFIIANSMIPHSTKRIVERVKKFKENNEEEFSTLCGYVTSMISDVLRGLKMMDSDDEDTFEGYLGMHMNGINRFLQTIGVSNPTLNSMLELLSRGGNGDGGVGLLSAKITGAGDGGCVIALVEERDKMVELLTKARAVLGKDKECFSAKIDTKGVVWSMIQEEDDYE